MHSVLIVEDQVIIRKTFENMIEESEDFCLSNAIENAALAEMYCAKGVNLVLMDVYTAHRENGLEAAAKIKKNYPNVKVIIVTSMPEESFIRKAKEAGCDSFWYKDSEEEELLDVMKRTMAGERVYPAQTPAMTIGLADSSEFTERELEVLRELVNGYSRAEICERLGIKIPTLNYHIGNLLSKSGYSNIVKLEVDVVDKKFIIPGF